eukprot:gene8248-14194_t
MGDSDDEYDRRRVRDKFRGERSEYEQRRPRGEYRDRRDWGDRRGRDSWSGGRDQGWDRKRGGQYYGRPRRDSEGGDGQISPPLKRNRRDWDSSYEKNFSSGVMPSPGLWSGGRGPLMQHQSGDSGKQGISESGGDFKSSQPPKMMTFKSFLIAQEENIDEMEAVRRFQEYKTEFKRTQLSDFFVTHKDEEWFKNKYHPIDSKNQAKEKRNAVKKRLQIFLDMLESGQMGDITLDGGHSDAIMKLLDSVAIRLEEGASDDLEDKKSNSDDGKDSSAEEPKESKEAESKQEQIENEEDEPLSPSKVPLPSKPPPESQDKGNDHSSESESEAEPRPPGEDPVDFNKVEEENENGTVETVKSSRDEPEDEGEADPGPPGVDQYESKAESEGRNISDDSGNESERKRDKENSNNLDANHEVVENDEEKKEISAAPSEGESGKEKKDVHEKEAKSGKRDWDKKKRKGLGAFVSELGGEGNDDSDSDSESESDEDEEDVEEKAEEQLEVAKQQSESVGDKRNESTEIDESKDTEQEARESHKTLSLYMRSVPPNISKADIAAVIETVKSSRDEPEDEGEADPGPPGVDQYESKAESEGRNISDDSGNESERKRDKENSNNLDANHEVVENDEEKKEISAAPSEGESGKEKKDVHEKEAKSGKRDWDKKKRKGLGAFVSELGGEGNDDSDSDSESESDEDEEDVEEKAEEQLEVAKQQSESVGDKRNESTEIDESKDTEQEARESHKTLSLYMRSVPPNISKADIAAVCKRYPGYLRVALSDPSPERGFCRRGWVTFENSINIKDICWNLSNIRIKDCELIPVVNRDLLKRIRPISGITLCNKVVRFDIYFSTKLIKALDEKIALYSKDADDEEKDQSSMDIEVSPRSLLN